MPHDGDVNRNKSRRIDHASDTVSVLRRCEEALEFYKKALGAEVEVMMRFKESPEPPPPDKVPPGSENKVMHSCFRVGGAPVMASDGY
jgi:PhnB protein